MIGSMLLIWYNYFPPLDRLPQEVLLIDEDSITLQEDYLEVHGTHAGMPIIPKPGVYTVYIERGNGEWYRAKHQYYTFTYSNTLQRV